MKTLFWTALPPLSAAVPAGTAVELPRLALAYYFILALAAACVLALAAVLPPRRGGWLRVRAAAARLLPLPCCYAAAQVTVCRGFRFAVWDLPAQLCRILLLAAALYAGFLLLRELVLCPPRG